MGKQQAGRVLVVDGDPEDRAFTTRLIERAGWATEGVETGEEAVARARAEPPRMVILEVALSGMSGYEACRELRDEFGEQLPIFFVSGSRTDALDQAAGLHVGADDYLTKPLSADMLLARVRRVLARSPVAPLLVGARLTPREREVLSLLVEGLRRNEIASELCISAKTTSTHIEHILRKLGAHSQAQAVAFAVRDHLVDTAA